MNHLSKSITLPEDVKAYIAEKTSGCTPAQVQRVVHGMAISHIAKKNETTQYTRSDVDYALASIAHRKSEAMGFKPEQYHNKATSPD